MKKKGLIAIFSVCITLIVALVATIVVLASGTQGIGTNVSVLYVATDIEGEVSATYSRVNKNTKAVISTTDMVTSSGAKKVSFLASQPTTTSLLNPTESNIALTAEQDLIITYTFSGVAEYYASLEYVDKDQAEPNIEFDYALNDGEYSKELSMPIKVDADKSTTFSIKLHIANTARNANLSGSLNWILTKQAPVILENYISLNVVNNTGCNAIKDASSFKLVKGTGDKQNKFKIVGAVPTIQDYTATNVSELTNANNAEFYYFCTNTAVVGSTGYNDPGEIYYTSTEDNTLENWYNVPNSPLNLYSCFMKPNCTASETYSGTDTQVIISNDKTIIDSNEIRNNSTMVNIVIPQSVQTIGRYQDNYAPFSNCSKLEKIIIPNSVGAIFGGVFSYCTKLTSISIGSKALVYESAFMYCKNLTSITVSEDNEDCYSYENCLLQKQGDFKLLRGCKNSILPAGLQYIGSYAFSGCSGLTTISLPNSIKSIGSNAFAECADLSSIAIPSGITVIDYNVFNLCTSLTSVVIPSGVTTISGGAFYGCSKLAEITIPSSVTKIGINAFGGCTGLASATFEESGASWTVVKSGSTKKTTIGVSDPAQNATYLKSTYSSYTWTKNS